jgi:cell division initiation protein
MELSARDIHEKQFHDAWRGYNQEEVDDFLDKVAESFDTTARENVALRERVGELEQALTTSRETEEMLKATLVGAQQAAEKAISQAKEKAGAMVADAEERAARANEETKQRLASVDAEIRRKVLDADREHTVRRRELEGTIERLRSFESELRRRLQAFLDQQVKSLETLADDEAPSPRRPGRAEEKNGAPEGGDGRTTPVAAPTRAQDDAEDEVVRLPDSAAAAPHRRSIRSILGREE